MRRLSSNLTLFFRIFLPTAWISFFGIFALVIFLADSTDKPLLAATNFRIIYFSLFIVFFVIIYFTIFQLKRVETDNKYLFVTDYFKTYRYLLEDVKEINIMSLGLLKIAKLKLHQKGAFGKSIPFIIKRSTFEIFQAEHPNLIK